MPQEEKKTEETSTPEEQLASLQTELTETKEKLAETEKGLSTAHRTLTAKDKEGKQRASLESQIESIGDRVKILASIIAQGGGQTETAFEETVAANRPDLLKTYEDLERKHEEKRKQTDFEGRVNEYEGKVSGLGLTRKDDEYWDVFDLVSKGRFDRADMKLERIAETKDKKPAESSEASETELEKRIEEGVRKRMEDEGLLKTETGGPSGSAGGKTYTKKQVGDMSQKEYRDAFPSDDDFWTAVAEGRVKEE